MGLMAVAPLVSGDIAVSKLEAGAGAVEKHSLPLGDGPNSNGSSGRGDAGVC